MAETLDLGLSHYPPLATPDLQMANILKRTLQDPGIAPSLKEPANWPSAMQAEWGADQGASAAALLR